MKQITKYEHNSPRDLWTESKQGGRCEWWETCQGGVKITVLWFPELSRAGVATNGHAVWVDAYSPEEALKSAMCVDL